ncbi:hypothetical protein BDR26DRAFT_871607 [Obelidium mucronatum]|nr:hypothetical protein BDR26DRAFT_871607 [Obelidium mucronatum]
MSVLSVTEFILGTAALLLLALLAFLCRQKYLLSNRNKKRVIFLQNHQLVTGHLNKNGSGEMEGLMQQQQQQQQQQATSPFMVSCNNTSYAATPIRQRMSPKSSPRTYSSHSGSRPPLPVPVYSMKSVASMNRVAIESVSAVPEAAKITTSTTTTTTTPVFHPAVSVNLARHSSCHVVVEMAEWMVGTSDSREGIDEDLDSSASECCERVSLVSSSGTSEKSESSVVWMK